MRDLPAADRAATADEFWMPPGPLLVPIGDDVVLRVRPGDSVLAGTVLAEPHRLDEPLVLSPCHGHIGRSRRAWTPLRGETNAIEMTPVDGPQMTATADRQVGASATAHRVGLTLERFRRAGALFDDEGDALSAFLSIDPPATLRRLIVRCFDSEPGLEAENSVLGAHARQSALADPTDAARRIVRAAVELAAAGGCDSIHLAVAREAPLRERRAWRAAAETRGDPAAAAHAVAGRVHPRWIDAQHPAADPVLLTNTIAGIELPPRRSAKSAGCWIVSASTLAALADYLETGRPRLQVRLLVGLPRGENLWIRVPVGTPISQIVEHVARPIHLQRIVANGWMSGADIAQTDAVVDGWTQALWLFDEAARPEVVPCIRCGQCVTACPVRLLPIDLYERATRSPHDAVTGSVPADACIGCSLCTYVCPSHLPLAATFAPEVIERKAVPATIETSAAEAASAPESPPEAPAHAALGQRPRRAPMLDPLPFAGTADLHDLLAVWWTAAALPLLGAVVFFGAAALKLAAAGVATALLTEIIISGGRGRPIRGNLSHSGLMGLLAAMTLPATSPVWAACAGAAVAVGFGKIATGGFGRYVWHPALVGAVTTQFIFGTGLAAGPVLTPRHLIFGDVDSAVTVESGAYPGWGRCRVPLGVDAVRVDPPVAALRRAADGAIPTGHEPPIVVLLRDHLPPWEDTLIGATPGPMGATCSIALIVAGMYLIHRRMMTWGTPLGVLIGAAMIAWICPLRETGGALRWFPGSATDEAVPIGLIYVLYHLTSGQLMLAAFVLAGEPTTSPMTRVGRWRFGLGVGCVLMLMRLYGIVEAEGWWAVLLMNTIAPLIDRFSRPRAWGGGERVEQENR